MFFELDESVSITHLRDGVREWRGDGGEGEMEIGRRSGVWETSVLVDRVV